jgi:monoamine oxidase
MSVGAWLRAQGWGDTAADRWAIATAIEQEWARDADQLGVEAIIGAGGFGGGDDLIGGGYDRVPQLLARGLDIRVRTPVVSVEVRRGRVAVERADGAVESADIAIVAVPLALLRQGRPRLPGLPADARRAIRRLTTGRFEKIALRYDRDHWGDRRVLGAVPTGSGLAAQRWTAFYSHTDIVGAPVLVGLAGGRAAAQRPAGAACAVEAAMRLQRAYGF